jgi:hypothetical protein
MSKNPTSGLADALRALRMRPGAPTDADIPKPRPFPGKKVRPIRGQLAFDGNEVGLPGGAGGHDAAP